MSRDDDDGTLVGQGANRVIYAVSRRGVQLRCRLVHKQEIGIGRQSARQHQTLRLTTGQLRESCAGAAIQAYHPQSFFGLTTRIPVVLPSCQQRKGDMILSRSPGDTVRILKHPRDRFDVEPLHGSLRRLRPSGEDTEQSALARSGRARQRVDLIRLEVEGQRGKKLWRCPECVRNTFRDDPSRTSVMRLHRHGLACEVSKATFTIRLPDSTRTSVCPYCDEAMVTATGLPAATTQAFCPVTA